MGGAIEGIQSSLLEEKKLNGWIVNAPGEKLRKPRPEGVMIMEVDEYEERMSHVRSGRLVVGQQAFALWERVRFPSGV